MKTKKLLAVLVLSGSAFMFGQTTISVSVNSSLDDHEERINGSVNQTQTLGSMDAASSDLELGNEKPAADPQLVGMRFNTITIPANAVITNAYIQFTVDDIAKNTDPCVLTVHVEDNVNPGTFSNNPFSLTSRTLVPSPVTWTVSGSTWSVVGSATTDQRTPDIKTLVQSIVNKAGWTSGNSMAFFIKGYGTREVESFDGDVPAMAPKLVVQYSVNVATGVNDLEINNSSVNIYPNPFNSTFNMKIEIYKTTDLTISVYDIAGKLIESTFETGATTGSHYYAPSGPLTPGMYFIEVKTNNQQQTFKAIAQ